MEDIPSYAVGEFIREAGDFAIYRALKKGEHGHEPVLLKVPAAHRPSLAVIRRLEHEYEVTRELDPKLVLRPIRLERYADNVALVLENGPYVTLEDNLGAPMEIKRFLKIAIGAAAALGEIHRHDLVHKDIKPQKILWDEETGQVRITGLGIASRLPRVLQAVQTPALLEGTLAYMSPEQTGRMNRALDYRSDFYSLGVLFYQMLTGVLPFQARDLLEWVHCHIARFPPSPSTLIAQIPEMVSALVMKLLAKTAEERYQTAAGLEADLRRCLGEWDSHGHIAPFSLGAHDMSDRLLIPENLYGRESQIRTLFAAFNRVIASGTPELLLVSGYSGIGKSSVVNELHKLIVPQHGLFAAGKFDQYKRDIPYATLVQALQTLIRQILGKSESEVAAWRDAIQKAVSPNGQLIISLIPEVELIIGKQLPVPELPPQEAQNRFLMVLRRFLCVFARPEHPLALFLDDLQWLDAATLDLIEQLVSGQEVRHLLLIGAYRDNEVGPTHPLMRILDAIRKRGVGEQEIVLAPLAISDVVSLVADSLHCDRERALPLSQLVHEKTGGNPFFIIQFLTELAEEKLLASDPGAGCWNWDLTRIHAKGYTDNVVDLMVGKIGRLPTETLEALKQFACLGNVADIATLRTVYGQSEKALHEALWEAVRSGLILRQEKTYSFLHDRVQEGAYALVPENRRKELHLKIGRLLLAQYPQEVLAERFFEVVDQFNRSVELITDAEERTTVRRLNTAAGRKARGAVAYASAQHYLEQAMALLPTDAWNKCYAESLTLFLELAECEYLVSHFQRADELLTAALEMARTKLDLASVHRLRLRLYQISGRYREALEVALEALRLFGVTFPEADEDIRAATVAEHRLVLDNVGGRRIIDLLNIPPASDAETLALLGLLPDSIPPNLFLHPERWELLTAKAVNICLQRGHSDESSFLYSVYAMALAGDIRNIVTAQQFSEMSIALNAQTPGAGPWRGKVLFHHGCLISIWRKHFATCLPLLEQAFRACLDFGDFVHGGYVTVNAIWLHLENGDQLDHVIETARRYVAFARQNHIYTVYHVDRIEEQFALSLQGMTRSPTDFSDSAFDEATSVAAMEQAGFGYGIALYYVMKQIAAFLDERYGEALEWADRGTPSLRYVPATAIVATHHFYHALTLAALHAQAPAEQQRHFAQRIGEILEKLKSWADNCPENFANRYYLVSAEIARIEGRDMEAMRLYDQAMRSARDNNFVHQEALAAEVASRFYRAKGFDRIADAYLRDARNCYARWGADGKVKQLEARHPWLRENKPLESVATIAASPEQVDMMTVIKAQQAISGEIVVNRLVETLLRIVLENAGAQNAYLLVERNAELFAVIQPGQEGAPLEFHRAKLKSATEIAPSILNYVKRTRETVILSDASADAGEFSADEYLLRAKPKSVLCMPIIHQAKLSGILYLENNLVAGAFTPERRALLGMLASQVSISLETALLYSDLQQSKNDLQNQTRILQSILDSMGDGVLVANERGEFVMFNPAAENILGIHFTKGKPDQWPLQYGLYLPDQNTPYPASELPLAKAIQGESVDGVEVFVRHPGQPEGVWLRVTARPLTDKSGITRGGVAVFTDFTENKKTEGNLRQAKEESEAANRAKDIFFAMLSHELRTPLTPILSGINTLAQESVGESLNTLEVMRRNLILESRLIDDLLDITRITQGKLAVKLEPLDAHQAIRGALETCRLQMVHLNTVVALDAPEHIVTGDTGRLQQVVRNLLQNAARFTPEGGRIEILTSNPVPGTFRLICRDTGVGIDPGNLTRIFKVFEQSDRSVKAGYGGLGLGLAISKALVEAHGGTITAQSEGRGLGATFEVTLHTTSAAATLPEPERSSITAQPVPNTDRSQLRILLVEDHTDTRQMLERLLKRSGYKVETAEDARTARNRAQNTKFDIFISDIGLPDTSGLELVRSIHQNHPVPAIALSGFGTESDLQQSREAGFAEHLVKPIDFKRLCEVIERLGRGT